MGFTNQVVSSFADFITKLDVFLAAEGWTTFVDLVAGEFSARKTPASVPGTFDIAFALQWDTAAPGVAGIYQHLGAYNNVLQPFDQVDDSGNGAQSTTAATLALQRHVSLLAVPDEFWCFTDAAGTYFHCAVRRNTTDAIHFGAGALFLYGDGDITGGEYVYGHRIQTVFNNSVGILSGTSILLDGIAADGAFPIPSNMEEFAATIHLEGFPGAVASQKWQVNMGNQLTTNLGTDRAAIARGINTGGFRAGCGVLQWGEFIGSLASGLIPGYPINTFYREFTAVPHRTHGPLGRMKDVRGINIANFVIGDTVVIGSDTWHIFPSFRKFISGALTNTSGHQGIMYKEIP